MLSTSRAVRRNKIQGKLKRKGERKRKKGETNVKVCKQPGPNDSPTDTKKKGGDQQENGKKKKREKTRQEKSESDGGRINLWQSPDDQVRTQMRAERQGKASAYVEKERTRRYWTRKKNWDLPLKGTKNRGGGGLSQIRKLNLPISAKENQAKHGGGGKGETLQKQVTVGKKATSRGHNFLSP